MSGSPLAVDIDTVLDTLLRQGGALREQAGVLALRPGLRAEAGAYTDERIVVALMQPGASDSGLPDSIAGVGVQARTASPIDLLAPASVLAAWQASLADVAALIGYRPPDPSVVALEDHQVGHITCHVGPDAGWSLLEPFLQATEHQLSVSMYEFYAEHIVKAVEMLGEGSARRLDLILQVSPEDLGLADTLRTRWDDRLGFTPALVSGPRRIFKNSYHSKIAVRDSSALWLSSGNWSPNSQPRLASGPDPLAYSRGNREWHVIVDDTGLAQMFEKFIEHDIAQARKAESAGPLEAVDAGPGELPDLLVPLELQEHAARVAQPHRFEPRSFATGTRKVRVKPLMSPDNYAGEVLNLIESARSSLYLQFAYVRSPTSSAFGAIIAAVAQKMDAGLDVRVLVGANQVSAHSELLIARHGWKREALRRQRSLLHNKGVLIDGRIALVGSNNWSADGVEFNRDASLVFFDRAITRYFTEVFEFDWTRLSSPIGPPMGGEPMIAGASLVAPAGFRRVKWRDWFDG